MMMMMMMMMMIIVCVDMWCSCIILQSVVLLAGIRRMYLGLLGCDALTFRSYIVLPSARIKGSSFSSWSPYPLKMKALLFSKRRKALTLQH